MFWRDATASTNALQPLYLVEEITHRVANEYADAIAALFLAATSMDDPGAQTALAAVATRLGARAEAHRALRAPATEGLMELGSYVGQVCASLSNAGLAERGVSLLVEADDLWLDAERCWRVALIVAELINNSARHGFSGGPGAIRIGIIERAERIVCWVRDNGCGSVDRQPSRGHRVVEGLATELGGSVDWSFTQVGCNVRLEFPVSKRNCQSGREN
jgi:two-component sensor histidine kinase